MPVTCRGVTNAYSAVAPHQSEAMRASAEGLEEGSDSLAATGEGLREVRRQVASDGS